MNIPSRPDCCLWYSYRRTTERRLNKHYSLVKNMTLRSGTSAAVTSATTSQGSAACLCFSSKTFPFDRSPAPRMCFYQHLHVRMFSFTVHLHDIPFWVFFQTFFCDIMFLIWQRKNVLYNKRYETSCSDTLISTKFAELTRNCQCVCLCVCVCVCKNIDHSLFNEPRAKLQQYNSAPWQQKNFVQILIKRRFNSLSFFFPCLKKKEKKKSHRIFLTL